MSKHLGTMGILREAFILPFRNKKLMFPIILVSFVTCSLLMMASYLTFQPLLTKLMLSLLIIQKVDPNTPEFFNLLLAIKREAVALLNSNLIFTFVTFVLSSFTMIMVVFASAMTYYGKQLTAHELLVRMRGTWKGTFLTRIYVLLLYMGYAAFSIWFTVVLMLNADGIVGMIAIGFAMLVATVLFSVYLSMVWMVGVVVSVVEEGCYGLKALGKGVEMVKGRKMQGFTISCVLNVVCAILMTVVSLGFAAGGPQAQKAAGLVGINMILLFIISLEMVYTVFYLECSKKHEMEVEVSEKALYVKVPLIVGADSVDEGLP